MSRSWPTAARIASHSAAVRWSFQRIAGRSTRSAASSRTAPCIWPASPIASTASPRMPADDRTDRMAATAPVHHSPGSCSLQSGWGVSNGYSATPMPTTAPDPSTRTAFVAVVEMSSPRTWLIGRPVGCSSGPTDPGSACRADLGPRHRVDRPDRPVDDVLEQPLATRHRAGVDVTDVDPIRERIKGDRARQDRSPELAGPAGVALGSEPLEGPVLDQGFGDEERPGERVDPADVGMEQVVAAHALAAQLRVEVEPAAREPARPDDLVQGERELVDRVRELVGVPAVLCVAAVGVDAAEQPAG